MKKYLSTVVAAGVLSIAFGTSGAADFLSAAGQGEAGRQKPAELDRAVKVTMKYLVYLPKDYDQKAAWPLVLFLHGSGERGDNLELVQTHGLPKLIAGGKDFPFIVVSPQCPKERSWEPFKLMALLDEIAERYKVDQDRIYVTGLSMGGYGTWSLAFYAPDRFAAIVPICGGGDASEAKRIAHIPAWVFHGAQDPTVPLDQSLKMVEALRKIGAPVKFTVYPEAKHDSWTEAYNTPELYPWLLQQKRTPKKVDGGTTPIVTYWSGPSLTDAAARQMAEGGWNLVWCGEKELDVAQRHGLRAQLQDGLLAPATLDNATQRAKLDALIARVRNHPALYAYFIIDEPSTAAFPALGKLVAYLRERDPAHLAYINLFPTYADNDQLGTKGGTITAYKDYLRQYIGVVKPSLLSYDHYQFTQQGDNPDYFLNLMIIRRTALEARVPFLNIVQACAWSPAMRGPARMSSATSSIPRWPMAGRAFPTSCTAVGQVSGGIVRANLTPTPLYHALKSLNREFVAVAKELQPLRSLAVYHAGMLPPGAEVLPAKAPFRFDPPLAPLAYAPPERVRGLLLGYFGTADKPSHVVVVNLDYKAEATVVLAGPGSLQLFDAKSAAWSAAGGTRIKLRLPPGGGSLVRVHLE